MPAVLLGRHEGPVPVEDLEHFADVFSASGTWHDHDPESPVPRKSPRVAVVRCDAGVHLGIGFSFLVEDCSEAVPSAVALSIRCYDTAGEYLGGPAGFGLSKNVGPFRYMPASEGANRGSCVVAPPTSTRFIVIRVVPWAIAFRRLDTRLEIIEEAVREGESILSLIVDGPAPTELPASLLDREALLVEETGALRLALGRQFGVKRVVDGGPLRVSIAYDVESGYESTKALALGASCYCGDGRLIGGAEGFSHSNSIGFYRYVTGRPGPNVETRVVTPLARTRYVALRLAPWEIQAITWPPHAVAIEPWDVFARRKWGEGFGEAPVRVRSGIWLVVGGKRRPVRQVEELRRLLDEGGAPESLEIVLDAEEADSPIRSATAGFFTAQFMPLTEHLSVAIERGVVCRIRASTDFLRTVPAVIAEHSLIRLDELAT